MISSKSKEYQNLGLQAYSRIDKINGELFTLTYGAMVAQILKDYEDIEEVNHQLDKMGFNIGQRLIDEFLARSGSGKCNRELKEIAEIIAKVGFRMFLNVNATVGNWSADEKEFSIMIEDNPLTEFVELPDNCAALNYCSLFAGVVRGCLEMVQIRVECKMTRCTLKGDDCCEMRVLFKEYLQDEIPNDGD